MVYRSLRIPVWLMTAALSATFVIGSTTGRAVRPDVHPAFRIVTPDVSDVFTQDVTPEIARTLHMYQPEGVLVTHVTYSPLREGDVILAINGNPVRCQRELDAQLAQVSFGQTLFVEVLRDGQTQTVIVQRVMETPPPPMVLQGTVEIRGIKVASLSTQNGVMVVEVRIGTPASDAGLKAGDIILDVDGHAVHTAAEFLEFMRQLNNRHAAFNVRHTNGQIDVFVIP
jgi:S1-C subfamily serine protease